MRIKTTEQEKIFLEKKRRRIGSRVESGESIDKCIGHRKGKGKD